MKPANSKDLAGTNSPSLDLASFAELKEAATTSELEILSDLSLLDSFTENEALKISKNPDLSQKIKQLFSRQYLSLISTSPNRYQINNLIRDGLRDLLSENEIHFKDIAFKSAESLKSSNPLKALELYGLAGDAEAATKHIISNLHHFLLHSDIEVLMKWAPLVAKALGGGINREKLVKAYGLLASGKYESLKSTIREIEVTLGSDSVSRSISEDLIPLKLFVDFSFGYFPNVLDQKSQILNGSDNPSTIRNGTLLHRIFLISYFYLQDREGFTQYFKELNKPVSSDAPIIELVHINSFKAMDAFLSGHYLEASEFALAACNLADELNIEGAYYPFESAYILMDIQLEFGNEEKSQNYLDKYLGKAIKTHQYAWIVAFYAKAALIKAQSGNFDGALSFIRKGRELIDSPLYGPHITYILDGHELIVRLPLGDMERTKELLFKLSANGNHKGVQTFNYSLEILQNPAEAERIAELMPNETDQDKFHKELLLAAAYASKPTIAMIHVKNAVELAVPNGYFRAFLNMPPQVKDYVLQLATQAPTNYLENLARAIRNQTSLQAINSAAMEKPLTKQELVILRRLDSGLPISQIATALSISKNTIKTHLKSVYRKLGAESRKDAVNKARELMLL